MDGVKFHTTKFTMLFYNQIYFLILTKHISLERSDSQGFIFGDCFVVEVTEMD